MHDALTINKETDRWQVGSTELHAGDVFELQLEGGSWLPVRFLWEHHEGLPPTGYCTGALAKGQAKLLPPLGATARTSRERS